ncbi:LysR substrate-binding domain-containing protein [Kineococcus glutinatus]|uniref:LysR substrate-binding domain-containing protein n=1 Tax=Kineococcus glutinatus TaxID=1070872 RepID=UPI0031EBF70D
MELRHLRYFVAVAEERHFGRAAARLHMAQPPLSQQVRALEAELGVVLLERTTRRVELTAAGAAYLLRARAVLAAVDDAAAEARRIGAGLVGRLAIGCVGSASYTLLPALAKRLRAELPDVDVTCRGEVLVPDLVESLRRGALDLALLRPPVDAPDLRVVRLRRERLVVALPTDHPLARRARVGVGDLRAEPFVLHARRSVMHSLVVGLCRDAGFEPAVSHEVAETSTLVQFVAAGLGVAVVPEPVAALGVPGVTHRPLSGRTRVDLAVATRAGDDAPLLRRALAQLRHLVPDAGVDAGVHGEPA